MPLSRWFLHFAFFVIAQCEIRYLKTVETDTNALNSLIKNLTKESHLTSLIVSSNKHINMKKVYQETFETFCLPIKNYHPNNAIDIIHSNDCILLLDSFHGIQDILNQYKSTFWDTGNFYVLRFIDETDCSPRDVILDMNLQSALERLWRLRRIYKVVISIGDKYVYYDPFESSETKIARENESDSRKVLEMDSNKFGALRISSELLISSFVGRRDFNGYKLIASTFEYITMTRSDEGRGGSDSEAMNEICRMMNVTPIYLDVTELLSGTKNDTFTSTLDQLIRCTADVGFNGFFIKNYEVKAIEFTGYVTSDSICVVVPKRSAIPNYLAIVRVFSASTWILIVASHIVISVIYLRNRMIFEKNRKKDFLRVSRDTGYSDLILEKDGPIKKMSKPVGTFRRIYGNYVMGFFDAHMDMKLKHSNCRAGDQRNKGVWNKWRRYDILKGKNPIKSFDRILLTRPMAPLDPDHSTSFVFKILLFSIQPLEMAGHRLSERFVLACSLLLGVVLGGSFTSQLASSYSKPAFYKNIETLKELEESGLTILTNFQNLRRDVFADDSTSILSNLQAKLQLVDKKEMDYRALVTRKAAVLERKRFLPFSAYGNHQMHVVEECPKEYNLAFVVAKGSAFLPRINEIIGRLQNGGLYEKWFKDMKPNIKEIPSAKLVVIRVNHLYLPFAILLLGLSCATIILFCERKGYI